MSKPMKIGLLFCTKYCIITISVTMIGGETLGNGKYLCWAEMMDFQTIAYHISSHEEFCSVEEITLYDGERKIPLSVSKVLDADLGIYTISVNEKLDITKTYVLEVSGKDSVVVFPRSVFDCAEFLSKYTYDGDDLGAVIHGNTTIFKVWAPTASKVILNLYADGHTASLCNSVDMVKADRGVWVYTANYGSGTYYTYTVTTAAGTQETADPYARAAGLNGKRSMVIDLHETNPDGWEKDRVRKLESYTDAILWEIHIRDFSNAIHGSRYPGKYLAFTEKGLVNAFDVPVGIDYLKMLGITHVHLMPAFDYATVDEADPNSAFNWGYDPQNYNVPEGSYATDPYKGEVRIKEFKQMVQALHEAGIGVVMDVVYNHTYDANASFNKIVPYYYYRYDCTGKRSDATGCGNDTASERYMFRKFMVDSVCYWAQEYHLDGFRFDLMGLHDLQTMDQIEKAVHAIHTNAILYGEGWTMGRTMDDSMQANQGQIHHIQTSPGAAGAIAVFNDTIRDGLKGAYDSTSAAGYINGAYSSHADNVRFGIAGGMVPGNYWRVDHAAVINYMSAHDNNTLWDKIQASTCDATLETRLAMNRMGAAIILIAQGTPFWQAGEEMLRSKTKEDGSFDENSYCSSDKINNIQWDKLEPGNAEYEMMLYYKGLIEMRKAYPIFRGREDVKLDFATLPCGGMSVLFTSQDGSQAYVVINPTDVMDTCTLDGCWKLVANGTQAGAAVIDSLIGDINIDAHSVMIFVR